MQHSNRAIGVARKAALAMALTLGVFAGTSGAQDQEAREEGALDTSGSGCSNHTLRGDYGFVIDGTIFAGPTSFLLRGVAMTHFDGHGGLTQVDFTTRNGAPTSPDWRPATGTYEVNEDCTGRAEIVPATGPPLDLRLVVFDGGRQVATVVVGNATGSLGTRVR
jgi:hypothetical protein